VRGRNNDTQGNDEEDDDDTNTSEDTTDTTMTRSYTTVQYSTVHLFFLSGVSVLPRGRLDE
jgi:hypothetical protein